MCATSSASPASTTRRFPRRADDGASLTRALWRPARGGSLRHVEWAFIWLMVVLKIPVIAAIWLVWWAMKAEPELDDDDDGGIEVADPPSPHRPRRPHHPRRGPHGDPEPPSPPRVRTAARPRRHVDA